MTRVPMKPAGLRSEVQVTRDLLRSEEQVTHDCFPLLELVIRYMANIALSLLHFWTQPWYMYTLPQLHEWTQTLKYILWHWLSFHGFVNFLVLNEVQTIRSTFDRLYDLQT